MLIFYAWVIFLVAVILSVPIVYTLEQRKLRPKEASPVEADPESDELVDDAEGLEEVAEGEPELGGGDDIPADFAEFGSEKPVGEDDFSAFEEEFK
ncbi:MAG: hypothetical protein EA381_18035 [Planctomycetaceae bacterium]|nr:MAG: hypothetical protein EA381_18035 [Planctomycetaceae bacterium]